MDAQIAHLTENDQNLYFCSLSTGVDNKDVCSITLAILITELYYFHAWFAFAHY